MNSGTPGRWLHVFGVAPHQHYQEELEAGRISSESNQALVLDAIPIIIDSMDDTDKEWAIKVFDVLASIQTDCQPPKKEHWQDWWKRKQDGEAINWTIRFSPGANEEAGSNP